MRLSTEARCMSLELHLKVVGLILLILGPAHAVFPRRFSWKSELEKVSLLTRQIFYVHHFFIGLVVTMLGALCLFGTSALLQKTPLGAILLGGITFFWLCRLVIQFFIFDASHWRGHRFNTQVHIAFVVLWIYLVGVFGAASLHLIR